MADRSGEPEVGQVGVAGNVEKHVLGLDVSVQERAGVGVVERRGELGHKLGCERGGKGALAGHFVSQVLPPSRRMHM